MGRSRLWQWVAVGVLALILLAGQSWAIYRFFTSRFPGGNDFWARWYNGCTLLWTGENPYSEEVAVRAQIGIFGRPARPGEDLAAFSYPLYTLFVFWPLCLTRNFALALAIWMTAMLYSLLAGLILMAHVSRWSPPRWLWWVTLAWGALHYPHARAIILGQPATVVFVALALSLWALERKRDFAAGALLALTTIKPQMSFLLLPWLLWWTAWRGRWGVWKGFALAMAVLAGASFLLVPSWLSDFIAGVRDYDRVAGAANYRSLTWIITDYIMGWGPPAETVGVGLFALYALFEMWRGRRAAWSGFLWTTGLILILTHFIAPRTATTHYSMLLLPLFGWFAHLQQRLGQRAAWVLVGIEALLLVGQWVVFLLTIEGNFETAWSYLPLPLLLLAVQLWQRRYAWREGGSLP